MTFMETSIIFVAVLTFLHAGHIIGIGYISEKADVKAACLIVAPGLICAIIAIFYAVGML